MTLLLDDALKTAGRCLGLLEAAVSRRLEAEKRRGDLETELQIMQDDRARLAVELDGALTRLTLRGGDRRREPARPAGHRRHRNRACRRPAELRDRGGLRMSQVSVTIAGHTYRIACGDGEEAASRAAWRPLVRCARSRRCAGTFGEIGDMRLHVMAAITIADELHETKQADRAPAEERHSSVNAARDERLERATSG